MARIFHQVPNPAARTLLRSLLYAALALLLWHFWGSTPWELTYANR